MGQNASLHRNGAEP